MALAPALGLNSDDKSKIAEARARRRQVALHLLANGLPAPADGEPEFEALCQSFLDSFREKARLLGEHRCPADQRIEAFLQSHFSDLNLQWKPRLPDRSLILDQSGLS